MAPEIQLVVRILVVLHPGGLSWEGFGRRYYIKRGIPFSPGFGFWIRNIDICSSVSLFTCDIVVAEFLSSFF